MCLRDGQKDGSWRQRERESGPRDPGWSGETSWQKYRSHSLLLCHGKTSVPVVW